MPPQSRYESLVNDAHQNVGDYLNKALAGIETANTSLYDVLEHIDFTRKVGQSKIPDIKLRQLITHFGTYRLRNEDFEFPDLLGAAYEYLIGEFADSAGKKGGEFYTPRSVVRMMVRLIKPDAEARHLRPLLRLRRHADRGQGIHRRARRRRPQGQPLRAGVQRHGVVHRQDEHAAARHQHRQPAERRHPGRAAARRRRRADALRPRAHQSAVLHPLGQHREERRRHARLGAEVPASASASARCRWAPRRPT